MHAPLLWGRVFNKIMKKIIFFFLNFQNKRVRLLIIQSYMKTWIHKSQHIRIQIYGLYQLYVISGNYKYGLSVIGICQSIHKAQNSVVAADILRWCELLPRTKYLFALVVPCHVPSYIRKLIFEQYYYFILGTLFGPKKTKQNVFHVIVQKSYQKKKMLALFSEPLGWLKYYRKLQISTFRINWVATGYELDPSSEREGTDQWSRWKVYQPLADLSMY